MTPDKIYVLPEVASTVKVLDEELEYIRKDALMEWLEERINDGDEEGLMTNQIANFAYKDVIDKINSL